MLIRESVFIFVVTSFSPGLLGWKRLGVTKKDIGDKSLDTRLGVSYAEPGGKGRERIQMTTEGLTDLRIVLANRPGVLAGALETLAAAEVNVLAMCGDIRSGERWGFLHVLVEDPKPARNALEQKGFEIADEHPVVIHEIENRPGSAHEVIKEYRDKDRNIEVVYTGDAGLIIGTEDMRPERLGVKMDEAQYQGWTPGQK